MRFLDPASSHAETSPAAAALRRDAAALVAAFLVACTGAAPALAQSTAPERAQRISVWGVPVAAEGEAAAAVAAEASAETRGARRQVVRSLAVERSRWGDSGMRRAAVYRTAAGDAAGSAAVGVEVTNVSYRWGTGTSRNAMDVGVGAGSYNLRSGADAAATGTYGTAAGLQPEARRDVIVPTLSVGMRHSLSEQHRVDLYASGTASVASPAVGEFYTAKVKVEWLPTRNSGFGFEQAAVNMKFSANSNFSLRVRGGGPMLYYRSKF